MTYKPGPILDDTLKDIVAKEIDHARTTEAARAEERLIYADADSTFVRCECDPGGMWLCEYHESHRRAVKIGFDRGYVAGLERAAKFLEERECVEDWASAIRKIGEEKTG